MQQQSLDKRRTQIKEDYSNIYILTHSGIKFHFMNPRPEEIKLEDIAHHAAMQCRWTGAVRRHFSVAQHMILCAEIARFYLIAPQMALACLLHDAEEAYMGDMASPLKYLLGLQDNTVYQEIGDRIRSTVFKKYGAKLTDGVHEADLIARELEGCYLINGWPADTDDKEDEKPASEEMRRKMLRWSIENNSVVHADWSPEYAEVAYMDCFDEIASWEDF